MAGGRGRPTMAVVLTDDERETLERWARRPKSAQRPWRRAVGLCWAAPAERPTGRSPASSACTRTRCRGGCRRFLDRRLDGLHDEPRPGAPRTISDDDVKRVVVKTLEEQPDDATHWSTRSMAKATGMSQTAVSKIWRAFGLKPHLVDSFKLSPDPQFIDKVRAIPVGLYLNPPDAAVVLCVDEKSQIQALDRTAPVLPLLPGTPSRRTHDYRRNGTTNLYAALDVASGNVITDLTPRHCLPPSSASSWTLIDRSVPADLAVHVTLDNPRRTRHRSIQRWLVRHPRFTLHFTPTYSSWLNLVERWFAELTEKMAAPRHSPIRP